MEVEYKMTDNLYDFAGLPYRNVTVRNNQGYRDLPSIDLSTHAAVSSSQRWEFDIDFMGGRDEDVIGKLMTHYIVNKHNTFQLPVPQNKVILDRAIELAGDDDDPGFYWHPDSLGNFTLKDRIKLVGKTREKIPAGLFINLPGDNKTYITSDNDSRFFFANNANPPGYPFVLEIAVYPRLRKHPNPDRPQGENIAPFKLQPAEATVIHSSSNNSVVTSGGLIQSARFTFVENTKPILQ